MGMIDEEIAEWERINNSRCEHCIMMDKQFTKLFQQWTLAAYSCSLLAADLKALREAEDRHLLVCKLSKKEKVY